LLPPELAPVELKVGSLIIDPFHDVTTRIVQLDENFLQWKHAFAEAWRDRLFGALDFDLVIVHPEAIRKRKIRHKEQ